MNQSAALFMLILMIYTLFGLACSITCAYVSLKYGKHTWHKVAAWILFINVGLTILGFLARMVSG